MPYNPKDHQRTHDPLSRKFSTPQPGKLSLIVGAYKANRQLSVRLLYLAEDPVQNRDQDTSLFVGGHDDEGQPNEVEENQATEALAPLIQRMEPCEAAVISAALRAVSDPSISADSDLARYTWYNAYVGDLSFEEGVAEVKRLLDLAGLEHEDERYFEESLRAPDTVIARAISALTTATTEMTHLMDIGEIADDSPLDRKVHAALEDLYQAVHDIRNASRRRDRLMERGHLVFPMRGQDMRAWGMSNGEQASTLLSKHQASRFAPAKKVMANPSLNRYRVMTASQYLQALEDAVIEE